MNDPHNLFSRRQLEAAAEHGALVLAAKNAIDSIPLLERAFCISAAADRDVVPATPSEEGLSDIRKSKVKKLAAANAELIVVQAALQKYSKYFNDACEVEYKEKQYKEELRALQKQRNIKAEKRQTLADEKVNHKMEHTAGFKERYQEKENLKKRKLGTDETKKPSIFDLF